VARQILSDERSRRNYDYAIEHPEERLYNEYKYYYARYEKYWRTDPRAVIIGTLLVLSSIQYAAKLHQHQRVRARVLWLGGEWLR
jgi:hypothetical protein